MQSREWNIYFPKEGKSVFKVHCAFVYKQGETSQLAGLRGMAPPVWTETGEKNNNRKMNKHESGTEPTFLNIWRVCNGARHTKHMVWLLPARVMQEDTLILGSAGTAGSEHTDDSISEVIWNDSHACEDSQSPYLPFKAKKLLHQQENRGTAGRLYSNANQWKAPLG